jgi:hypothetical protein
MPSADAGMVALSRLLGVANDVFSSVAATKFERAIGSAGQIKFLVDNLQYSRFRETVNGDRVRSTLRDGLGPMGQGG